MENYTIDNFVIEEVISSTSGRWENKNPYAHGVTEQGKFEVNYSDILTFLIKKAGTICDSYASDLFITWNSLEKSLHNVEYEGGKILFGFREMGVDSNSFVLCRANNYGLEQIKELYVLEIKTEKHYGSYSGYLESMYMTMTLGKAKLVENPEG